MRIAERRLGHNMPAASLARDLQKLRYTALGLVHDAALSVSPLPHSLESG